MKNNLRIMNYLVLILFFFFFNNVRCEIDNCNFGTCGDCISFEPERCVWCSQDGLKDRRCRPLNYTTINKSWCKDEHKINPQPTLSRKSNQDFGEFKDGYEVQLRPQLIHIKARPGITKEFHMSFRPAKDFPLDVYFLMDVSYTMQKSMSGLKNQAKQIYRDLSAYTNNVRLGIGSFVEKPGFPYYDRNTPHISHAFKNEVPLTSDMEQFQSMIDNIKLGANYDDPEAGLDALMQAMTCEKEVGWRPGARRIIVLCTDSTYHSAGDGKIVGAFKPNDMKCHLKNNIYFEALTYDYPSVSQINHVAAERNFRLIFAITRNRVTHKNPEAEYKDLTNQIDGSKYAQLEDGKNVIQIIKDAYEELANSIKLNFKAPPFVEVTIDQDCQSKPKRNCDSPHKQTVNITGTIKSKSCPSADDKHPTYVTINPEGLDDKLIIQLDVDCKCDCEKKPPAPASKDCHDSGYLQCGICKCNTGRYGADCRCNGTSTDETDKEKCEFVKGGKPCNGKAICRCGKCEKCDEGFSGDFCEFDDKSCPSPDSKLCANHGGCYRGQCNCDIGWTGTDCSCPNDNKDCFAPYSKEVCSGRGTCVCGVCQCDTLEGKNETYSGVFCDSCEECAEGRCKELENYAYCNYVHKNDKAFCDRENDGNTTEIDVFFMNKTEINGPKFYMAQFCKKEIDSQNGTYMVFKYQYEKNVLKITIQEELETPPEPNIWIAAGSAIGLVLLIGILTVIVWKILVDLHDKKEYQKFSAEALAQGYDVSQNPLYQDPSINFSNPVYNNQCN